MGAWGRGVFQNDLALDWVADDVQRPLVETIERGLASHDEANGPIVLAAVEVLALVTKASGANLRTSSGKSISSQAWLKKFLEGWDSYSMERFANDENARVARRREVELVFDRLSEANLAAGGAV
jgi:hypothetical protein